MKRASRILRPLLFLAGLGAVTGAAALLTAYLVVAPGLPSIEALKDVRLQVPLRVYTREGELMGVFGQKRRSPAAIENIPRRLQRAFLAAEDDRFYEHPGVDYQGLLRAVWHLARTGEKGPGGSTITMQLARNFFLSFERTYTRKIREIFLALKIERELDKNTIFELYLNKIYLGHRAYGVGAAADVYYGADLSELTLAQTATIASLPKAPSRINPITSPAASMKRRNYVLRRMHELGYIDRQAHRRALDAPNTARHHGPTVAVDAPYVAEMVRSRMLQSIGSRAYTGGYKVYTTIEGPLQGAARRALRAGLFAYSRRHGYRGAEAEVELAPGATPADWREALSPFDTVAGLTPGLVIDADSELAQVYLPEGQTVALDLPAVEWAHRYIDADHRGPKPKAVEDVVDEGDVIRLRRNASGAWTLAQLPEVQGAIVSLDPEDGGIRALSGGLAFHRSKFNRVTQSRRQPGSNFKPFIYSAALENGFTAATLVNDAPVVFDDAALERKWRPENYSGRFYGPTRLREGLVHSRNLVSIRVLRRMGIGSAREHITNFGFPRERLPDDLSLALGSASLTPLSVARGYAVFANGGFRVEPYFIERIENADGETVFQAQPPRACRDCRDGRRPDEALLRVADTAAGDGELDDPPDNPLLGTLNNLAERAITAQNAYIMGSMMRDVIERGTGRRARSLGREDLAGKTGTTNDQRDAWFSGFNHHAVTTAWVGFDQLKPLGQGEVGGRAALPIWIDFMEVALEGVPERVPAMPDGLTTVRIDPESGKRAPSGEAQAILEIFRTGHIPETVAKPDDDRGPLDPYSVGDPYSGSGTDSAP